MSLQVVDYIFDSNEYLCESYNRDKGMSVIKIPFKEVGVFADIGTTLGLCNLDNKYYYLLSLPEGISSMIVDSFYEDETESGKVTYYKIEITYDDGSIMMSSLTDKEVGEKLCEGDYLELHVDEKFYVDHKATYLAKNRVALKFARLHNKM